MFVDQLRQALLQTSYTKIKLRERRLQLQHGGGIDEILTGGASMDQSSGLGIGFGHQFRQFLYQRNRRVACLLSGGANFFHTSLAPPPPTAACLSEPGK